MELEKSLDVKIPNLDKGINTDLVNLTTHVKRSSNVEVEKIQGHEEDSIPKVNQETTKSI